MDIQGELCEVRQSSFLDLSCVRQWRLWSLAVVFQAVHHVRASGTVPKVTRGPFGCRGGPRSWTSVVRREGHPCSYQDACEVATAMLGSETSIGRRGQQVHLFGRVTLVQEQSASRNSLCDLNTADSAGVQSTSHMDWCHVVGSIMCCVVVRVQFRSRPAPHGSSRTSDGCVRWLRIPCRISSVDE